MRQITNALAPRVCQNLKTGPVRNPRPHECCSRSASGRTDDAGNLLCIGRRLSLKGVGARGEDDGGECAAVTAFVVGSAVTVWEPGLGPHDGEPVAVKLVEVVGHHQQSPLEAHLGSASSVEAVDAVVVLGVAEQGLDRLFAFSIPVMAVV